MKLDKWSKMIGQEENKVIVQEFVDKSDTPNLFITSGGAGVLPSHKFPDVTKQKGMSCYRKDV